MVTMPAGKGFCSLVQCPNKECLVSPSTQLFDGKTKGATEKKARAAWEKRKK